MLEWLFGDWEVEIQEERAARAFYGDFAYEAIKRYESQQRAEWLLKQRTANDRIDDVAGQLR